MNDRSFRQHISRYISKDNHLKYLSLCVWNSLHRRQRLNCASVIFIHLFLFLLLCCFSSALFFIKKFKLFALAFFLRLHSFRFGFGLVEDFVFVFIITLMFLFFVIIDVRCCFLCLSICIRFFIIIFSIIQSFIQFQNVTLMKTRTNTYLIDTNKYFFNICECPILPMLIPYIWTINSYTTLLNIPIYLSSFQTFIYWLLHLVVFLFCFAFSSFSEDTSQ